MQTFFPMTTLITIAQLALVWLGASVMGLAIGKLLLPEDIEQEHGVYLMPASGVLALCLMSFTISASFDMHVAKAVWISMGALALAGLATQLRPTWRIQPRVLLGDLLKCLVLMLPMALLVLAPLFYFGAKTYLGAVNPDFFAGLADVYYLMEGHSVTTFTSLIGDSFYPLPSTAGSVSASARFGSELFAVAVHLAMGVDLRSSLALTIGFSMLCLPLALYPFCRIVLAFDHKASRMAAWLIGVSAPIGMSYLYSYLGQNVGLPALPLLLTAVYLMLTRPGVRSLSYCAVLANGLFVNYFAMLPYTLAPGGALWLYLVFTRRLRLRTALLLAVGFLAISLAIIAGHLPSTIAAMRGWLGIIGQSLQGQYFLDFLTESFLSYFFGVYNYPSSPWAVQWLGQGYVQLAGFAVALLCLGLAAWAVARWSRDNPVAERRVFVLSILLIYSAVWAQYSFSRQYGYAVFKMSSWLQFMLVPFIAYAIHALAVDRAAAALPRRNRALTATAIVVLCLYAGLNVRANLQYAYNGWGANRENGYIVNHFGMSGNRDFFDLSEALAKHVKPNESIGLLLPDSIRIWWTTFYLRDFRQSFLAHNLMPGDDENLPDVESNVVVDYYGNVKDMRNEYLHGGTSDTYLLTSSRSDLNPDIVAGDFNARPVWENNSFRLFRASEVQDLLFTGAGFYRLEYFTPKEYFFPAVMRWSADGGEFFLLRPKQPGKPYRIGFDILVGYESPNDTRTLEFFQEGKKFGEAQVTHAGRVVSPPFTPGDGLTRLVVRIKEKNKPMPRPFALWNKSIPADYRRMNAAFANATLIAPDAQLGAAPPARGETMALKPLFTKAVQFSGFQLDGWIGDLAQMTLRAPQGAKALEITGLAPGNMGFTYPFKVKVQVNGQETEVTLRTAGQFTLTAPMPGDSEMASVSILPGQSRELGEEADLRHKILRRSLHIETLTFR